MKAKTPKPEKYVTEKTFEKAMTGIAKTLARMDEKSTTSTELILREIRTLHEDNKHFRESLSEVNRTLAGHDRMIDDLDMRVEKLEVHV